MSTQSTFKSTLRPVQKTVNTDLAGILDFSVRATSLNFTSGQSLVFTSISNAQHLVAGQPLEFYNSTPASIYIDASLMENGVQVEIEAGTCALFNFSSNGKFFNIGGSEAIKDLNKIVDINKQNYDAHVHDGNGTTKIKATDLDTAGSTEGHLLRSVGGLPTWVDAFSAISPDIISIVNSDTTTNINTAAWTEVPLGGTTNIAPASSRLVKSGNGIQVNFTGTIKVRYHVFAYSATSYVTTAFALFKNGSTQVAGTRSTTKIMGFSSMLYDDAMMEKEIQVTSGDVLSVKSILLAATGTVTMNGTDSFLEVEIPAQSMAKGAQGLAGYSGFDWLYSSINPTTALGVDGDVCYQTTTFHLWKRNSGTWTDLGSIQGAVGPVGPKVLCLHAERSTTLGSNTYNWSFGASATQSANTGIVMPWSGKLIGMSANLSTVGTTASTLTAYIGGSTTGKSLTIPASTRDAYVDWTSSPYTFSAGARLQIITTTAGTSASNGRVALFVQLD